MLSGGLGDLPVDLALLPSGQSISKHLGPSYGGEYMTEEGALLVGRSLQQFQLGDFMPLFLTTGILVATHARGAGASAAPRVVDEKERVALDLAQLSAGITIYKLSEGKYPSALDDLVKPLADYPDGCLQSATLPADPWGHAYLYKLNEKGKPFLWSMGPDGVDQQGGGDDITRQK
jgi:general secretion pathway protein G